VFGGLRDHDVDDVPSFLSLAATAIRPWPKTRGLLEEIENWVARSDSSSTMDPDIKVRVMTFQGAKGLEADTVCVVGLEEGTIPRSGASGEVLAEQARLLFVSMTRAVASLHLFHARTRSGAISFQNIHTGKGGHTLTPSSFLGPIPSEFRDERYVRSRS